MLQARVSSRRRRQGSEERETAEDRARSSADPPRRALVVLFGRVRGEAVRFALGPAPLQLGREVDDGHVELDDPLASRRHAELHWSEIDQRHWIRDVGSRNGVFVNGARTAREIVGPGDVIRVGDTVFRITADAAEPEPPPLPSPFVGASRSLRRSLALACRLAALDTPVLILGATGTGKDLIAGAIHRASRRGGALVPVNCAALPASLAESELFGYERGAFSGADASRAGLFRAAQDGTLFLDEIGELALEVQAKLLRALETRSIRPIGATAEAHVRVRVVAATNRDLAADVDCGRFRADVFARLSESVVRLDPLRDRPEDLAPLWHHFAAQLGEGTRLDLSGAAFEALALHGWPFNVRELRQVVRGALLARPGGGTMTFDDLPAELRRAPSGRPPAAPSEPRLPVRLAGEMPSARQLRQLVEEFHGNIKDVAAFLGKDRKQIYRWLRRDHIDPNAYRRGNGEPPR
jgi:DNA-binding NtrC family response regulator